MKVLLSLLLFGFVTIKASEDDHDHDHDHDHDEYGDCECASGLGDAYLVENCDTAPIKQLQEYVVTNDCKQYCHDHEGHLEYDGTGEDAWRCFQVYTLWIQYHNYCPTGAVNETLFHQYLDYCPGCYESHYEIEGAPDCDASLNCTNADAQVAEIQFVNNNCINTCTNSECEEAWQTVEGYHRVCDHDELSEEFDTLFDNLSFENTACENVHCNNKEEEGYEAVCTSDANKEWNEQLALYGALDVDKHVLGESGAQSIAKTAFAVIFTLAVTLFV